MSLQLAVAVEPLWFPLVKKFYQAFYPSGKPNKAEPLWVIKEGANILCAVRLKPLDQCLFLTGLVTHPQYRNQGIAGQLLRSISKQLAQQPSYCFNTPELIPFYRRHGFIEATDEARLPSELRSRLQRYRIKQPSLIAMKYHKKTPM
ncbi:GNAT family N-acetyltransferase [Marinomonas ostreistagni]|uniref:GNAT family N-acetyltransferase n=1 Tax=Marinomonas ostreistagni TaxID=359209 RepID=A0ABS0ZH94_9GAMM|nr:GNAT family N-acetyltransferase [Marinomonas ostreistagni]MBJ7552471.1 GNAT family N-acetyltransferase [Marinomonas ostreistagni]